MHATERPQQRAPRLHHHSSPTGPCRTPSHRRRVPTHADRVPSCQGFGVVSTLPHPFEDNDRDLARGLLLVLREKRHQRGLRGEEPIQVM